MTPELVDDLKQFIQAMFLRYGSEISDRFDGLELRIDNIEFRMDTLDAKIDGVEENLDIKLNVILDAVQERFDDHENVSLTWKQKQCKQEGIWTFQQ